MTQVFSFRGQTFTPPSYMPQPKSWWGHGPFAKWLVAALKPRSIVELGTHYGYSYFAMCEAVTENALQTRCLAVDTWEGDEHAGHYGEDVYQSVVAHNARYAHFSSLRRDYFVNALPDVPDGSVDLLHVDGRHFYDDVKEDYTSWLPKLSDRGVVMLHDTEVRERDFGVLQFWQEIRDGHPSINFTHCNGLGVLFIGPNHDAEFASFVDRLSDPADKQLVGEYFAGLGGFLTETAHLKEALEDAREETRLVTAKAASDLTALSAELNKVNEQNYNRKNDIQNLRAEIVELKRAVGQTADEKGRLRMELRKALDAPLKTANQYLLHRILRALSTSPLFSTKVRERLARSAAKRDPMRSG